MFGSRNPSRHNKPRGNLFRLERHRFPHSMQVSLLALSGAYVSDTSQVALFTFLSIKITETDVIVKSALFTADFEAIFNALQQKSVFLLS